MRHLLTAALLAAVASLGAGCRDQADRADRAPAEAGLGYGSVPLQFVRVEGAGNPGLKVRPPVPWAAALSGPGNVLGRYELGGELRWAQFGAVGQPLEARVTRSALPEALLLGPEPAEPNGTRLMVDVFVARRMPGKPADPRIRLTVHLGDREVARSEHAVERPEVWSTLELPFELPDELTSAVGARRRPPLRVRLTPVVEARDGAQPATFYLAAAGGFIDRPLPDPPAVLLVTSDTHRGDHLASSGLGVPVETPAMDALAERGVLFSDCFAPSHVTLPSHAALFTGVSPRDTGVLDNNTALAQAAPTLAEAFADAGWWTGAAVSLDLLADGHSGFGQGFERLSAPVGTRRGKDTVDAALRWLDGARGRPLFLWVHLADAHAPYEPPDGPVGLAGEGESFDAARAPFAHAPHWLPEVRDAEYVRGLYRGEVAYVDDQLGRLLAHPRAVSGIAAVTADHGEVLGRHDIWWRHRDLYPDTLHVPLILAWPGAPAGRRVDLPVEQTDLGRTLLDLAGLEGAAFPGRGLEAAIESASDFELRPRFAVATGWRSAAVDAEGWLLILHLRDSHRVELYHRAEDRYCEVDRIEAEPERAAALRDLLVRWIEAGQPGWAGTRGSDEAMLERLAELGYADQLEGSDAPAAGGSPAPEADCGCEWCVRFGPR